MSKVQCFWCEVTSRAVENLRRYHSEAGVQQTCAGRHGYHNAVSELAEQFDFPKDRLEMMGYGEDDVPHDDPRWPKACACGYVFQDGDHWQHNVDRLWRRTDTGELLELDKAPAGAMWDAVWTGSWVGKDGVHLTVRLPDGVDWHVDGPSSGGDHRPWDRTGTPPVVTAKPSILTPNYHGFLTDGFLISC